MQSKTVLRTFAAIAALALATVGRAQLQIHVAVDTHSLIADPAGPFSLDFQLNDGSGVGDGNNSAFLSNFQFGGGSAGSGANTFGGASGSLESGVLLNDTDPLFNEFFQEFDPGSWLSFDLTLTTNVDLGDTPDIFSFAILDGNWMNLPTLSFGSDTFLEINLDSTSPAIATFASADRPLTVMASAVPEPSTYAACGLGLLALLVLKRRFRRS